MFDVTRSLVKVVRTWRSQMDRSRPMSVFGRKFLRARYRFLSMVTGTSILLGARLGENISFPHPNGVVIHEDAVVGSDCMIMQQVTLGTTAHGGAPTLGNNVYVGAGAKILGSVKIGDRARIGANAVVMIDVPADSTAVGVPARIVD